MKVLEEIFQEWLDEPMLSGNYAATRLEFAKKSGVKVSDLRWAFCMGYCRGKDSMSKFVTDKLKEMESK